MEMTERQNTFWDGRAWHDGPLTPELLRDYDFEPTLTAESLIECPECEEWSPLSDWRAAYVGCEICGEHDAIACPRCNWGVDSVIKPTLRTR
jgi:hypothetical protein